MWEKIKKLVNFTQCWRHGKQMIWWVALKASYRKQTDLSSSLSSSSLCGLQTRRLSLVLQWAQTWSDLNKPPLRIQVIFSASHSAVLFDGCQTLGCRLRPATGSPVRPGAFLDGSSFTWFSGSSDVPHATLQYQPEARSHFILSVLQQYLKYFKWYQFVRSSVAYLLVLLIWGSSSLRVFITLAWPDCRWNLLPF